MTTAIHYSSINPHQDTTQVFGLQVAVSQWMKAYFRFSQQDKFPILVGDKISWDEVQHFATSVQLDPQRLTALDSRYARQNFGSFDTIFRADPHPQKLFWQRQQLPSASYNVCALAHAISGLESGEILERFCLDPSEPSDAIVCPSRAVSKAIRSFWDLYSDYVKQRFGKAFTCPVQLPVIPLGIDIEHIEAITTASHRQEQRQKLNIKDDDIVLLWVGRLSHAIKAHPLAMFQTAERVAAQTGANIHLVMLGYFVPEEARTQFRDLAKDVTDKATVTFIAHNDPRFPNGLWAAGDIFLSLIDNVQESFGLTPLEAMAAGLPRVMSDWDGYRDSVTHGEDGFLIPTHQPPPSQGRALSELLLSGREVYGGFLAKTAQCISVDQDQAVEAVNMLIRSPDKRHSMIDKARKRVCSDYHWKSIIASYEALWDQLAEQRQRMSLITNPSWVSALPQVPDPFTMYASYPSSPLDDNGFLTVGASQAIIKSLWKHDINTLALDILLSPNDITKIINSIADQNQVTINKILSLFSEKDHPALWRSISWLIKLGILRYVAPQ